MNYNGCGGRNANNSVDHPITITQQQPAYITIPMSQVQVVVTSAGATALPAMSMIPGSAEADVIDNLPPPKYDTVAIMKEDKEDANGGESQRF